MSQARCLREGTDQNVGRDWEKRIAMKSHTNSPESREKSLAIVVSTKEVKANEYVVRWFLAHRFGQWQVPDDFSLSLTLLSI
jgi:hypothetical protein